MLKQLIWLPVGLCYGNSGTSEENSMLNVLNWQSDLKMSLSSWNVNEQIGRGEYNWYLRGKLSATYTVAQFQQYELGLCIAITPPEPEAPADDASAAVSAADPEQVYDCVAAKFESG
mmetsp:Transcript_22032/g.27065  ORF Transcript_22032/g.27065 Transcript_22032/m.27065 type:complete len:117 (+) Transcript_22032:41-391(+)